MRMKARRIGVRAIVYKDNKILAVKHRTKDGGEADFWAIPGGGLDLDESLIKGVAREMVEETGISPQIGKLLFIQQYPSTRTDCSEELEFFFQVTNADDYAAVDLTTTTHGVAEIARIEFIDPTTENVLPRFIRDVPIAEYINSDMPVYIADYLTE